jgi:hypothetical protein
VGSAYCLLDTHLEVFFGFEALSRLIGTVSDLDEGVQQEADPHEFAPAVGQLMRIKRRNFVEILTPPVAVLGRWLRRS